MTHRGMTEGAACECFSANAAKLEAAGWLKRDLVKVDCIHGGGDGYRLVAWSARRSEAIDGSTDLQITSPEMMAALIIRESDGFWTAFVRLWRAREVFEQLRGSVWL